MLLNVWTSTWSRTISQLCRGTDRSVLKTGLFKGKAKRRAHLTKNLSSYFEQSEKTSEDKDDAEQSGGLCTGDDGGAKIKMRQRNSHSTAESGHRHQRLSQIAWICKIHCPNNCS